MAFLGATRGPRFWLRFSPPPIGLAAALVSPRQRAHIRHNLQSLLGHRHPVLEYGDVARTFICFAQSLAESLALDGLSPERIQWHVHGESHLKEALEQGRGVILGTAHTSGWEASLMALEQVSSASVLVAMRSERDAQARSFHPTAEYSPRRRIVPVGQDPLSSLPLLHHLRTGGIVAMQVDRCSEGMKTIHVRAGRKTWKLPAGPFVLGASCKAPIVLCFSRRRSFLTYDLTIMPPIRVNHGKETRAAEMVARNLARHVYAVPTQWFDFVPT